VLLLSHVRRQSSLCYAFRLQFIHAHNYTCCTCTYSCAYSARLCIIVPLLVPVSNAFTTIEYMHHWDTSLNLESALYFLDNVHVHYTCAIRQCPYTVLKFETLLLHLGWEPAPDIWWSDQAVWLWLGHHPPGEPWPFMDLGTERTRWRWGMYEHKLFLKWWSYLYMYIKHSHGFW
jgi:hypothetical protein